MTHPQLSGNKGEWSEVYVLFKLLAEGKLYAADLNLERIQNVFYPILAILQNEAHDSCRYQREDAKIIFKNHQGDLLEEFPIADFKKIAELILNEINSASTRSFPIPEAQKFMERIKKRSLKASSTQTKDITIILHDYNTGLTPELNFSIKSNLGSPPTLLNAGQTTNFFFIVKNLSDEEIEEINSLSGIKSRVKRIIELGGTLNFSKMNNTTFQLNLQMIDSWLPKIIAQMLIKYYSTKKKDVDELTELIRRENPLEFDLSHNHPFYSYQIKNMLLDMALGMTPSKTWTGVFDATGGYIVVKKDGDVVCYYLYNFNEFKEYLYLNTYFDTASSKRHKFGTIYRDDNGNWLINLNLQIRFSN